MALYFTPGDIAAVTASRRVGDGTLRRIARGIVTDDLDRDLADVVADHLYEIVGRTMPGAVVTDRSALSGGTLRTNDGLVLFVAHPERRRDLELHGHLVAVRTGAGPVGGDQPFQADGLYLASQARALVDNARLSRTGAAGLARTLSNEELEEHVDRLASQASTERLAGLRADVEAVAMALGEGTLGARVQELIGAAQGTRPDVAVVTPAMVARRAGMPVDRRRVELFDRLADALRDRAPDPQPTTGRGEPRRTFLPFFEAYFSNFIEGTEFEVDEAVAIVFEGQVPDQRTQDAHDIVGTHRIVADDLLMRAPPPDGERLLATLRSHHATIMQARPDTNPGVFKRRANRVGANVFVAPEETIGTLQAGWDRVRSLDDAFARAVTAMFVVAEVHPFDDGNGRVARIMMNTELEAASQARIIIPSVYRSTYLSALRAMTANGRPDALIAVLAFAQRWAARVDWSSVAAAQADLGRTNALLDPVAAEQEGLRLQLP